MRDLPASREAGRAARFWASVLALSLVATAAARGDAIRVVTPRGTFLVESDEPVVARAEGDELVIERAGDEVRLRLDAATASPSGGPVLTVRRGGKVVASARRLPGPAAAVGAGRTVLNAKAIATAWSLALTPDGRTLVSGHEGSVRAWDLPARSGRWSVPTGKTGRRVAITPDGATIASAEYAFVDGKPIGTVVVRDGKTGEARRTMKPVPAPHGVAIDPTGKVVVSSSWVENEVRVWDVETGDQVGTLKGHTGAVNTLAFSPDGKTLASAGDSTVRLWDVDTGRVRKVLRGHQASVESVAFSADGKTIASGGFDDDARVWDVETGKALSTLECDEPVLAVALSADGKSVATAAGRWGNGFYGRAPARVQIWDATGGKPRITLPDPPGQVFSLAFTPDGKSLVTASLAGGVTVWDLDAFRPAGGPPGPPPQSKTSE